jgi:PST family polysaccharide transporter
MEPVSFTMGWLLISQGRGRHLLQWGIIDGLLSIISIVAGLPWGAVGVAASFAIMGLCVRKQLQILFTGRSGPVRTSDIYRTIAPSACACAGVLGALYAFRRWVEFPRPLAGLVVSFALAVVVALLVFAILPKGRRALQDIKQLLPSLGRTRKASIE